MTEIAQKYWAKANVAHKISLRLGDALQTLKDLQEDEVTFDLIFIDANKNAYDAYYEEAIRLLRPEGLILLDNTLWHGRLIEDPLPDTQSKAIKELNKKIQQDRRVEMVMLPLSDGLTLVKKVSVPSI